MTYSRERRPSGEECPKTKPGAEFQYMANLSTVCHSMSNRVAASRLKELLKDHLTAKA